MMHFSREKQLECLTVALLFCIFLIFLILNWWSPIWSDDWAFYVGYGDHRVTSFSDVMDSLHTFYMTVNGRSVANFIVMISVFFGKNFFDVWNALVFTLLIFEMFFLVRKRKEINPLDVFFVFALLWFFVPAPDETLFWQCGSVVYLWMTALCFSFFIPFKGLLFGKDILERNPRLGILGMFCLGFFSGNSHELLSPVIIFLVVSTLGYARIKRTVLPSWSFFGVAGIFLGAVIQYVAPSNYVKLHAVMNGIDFVPFAQRPMHILENVMHYQIELWGMVFLVFCWYAFRVFFLKKKESPIDLVMYVFLIIAIGLCFMGVAYPYFPARAFFFSSIFLMLFLTRFFMIGVSEKMRYVLVSVLAIGVFFSLQETGKQVSALYKQYEKREISIQRQKQKGSRDIIVKRIKVVEGNKLMNDSLAPSPDKNYWASKFYEVDSVEIQK